MVFNLKAIRYFFFTATVMLWCGNLLSGQINPYIPYPKPFEFKPVPLGHSHDPNEIERNYRNSPFFNRRDPFAEEREKRAFQEAQLQKEIRRKAGVPLPEDLTEEEKRERLFQHETNRRQQTLNFILREITAIEGKQPVSNAQYLAQANLYKALSLEFERLITTPNVSLKQAVFLAERPQWQAENMFSTFKKQVEHYAQMVRNGLSPNPNKEEVYKALFRFFRDTTFDRQGKILHLPIRYDFTDYWGDKDYRNLHVLKLLAKNTGQCRSLPLLYKLLASELGVPAWICYAPNHSFIAHQSDKNEWLFLELTSLQYVPLSVYMESGFIRTEAMNNRIYLDTLSNQQLIASLWVDLASDFWHTLDVFDDANIVREICQKSLRYYPNNISARILLHNVCVSRLKRDLMKAGNPSAKVLSESPVWKARFDELQRHFDILIQLGFDAIPRDLYDAWLKKIS